MNLGFKLMMFSLVAMIALPMFMVKPDGEPMMKMSDWLPDSNAISKVTNKFRDVVGDTPALDELTITSSGKMYSWKDERGVMHFSEQPPPPSAQQVKVRDLPKEVNMMEAVKPRARAQSTSQVADSKVLKWHSPAPYRSRKYQN